MSQELCDQGGQGLVDPEGQGLAAQLQRRLVLPQAPAESSGQDGSGEARGAGLAVRLPGRHHRPPS